MMCKIFIIDAYIFFIIYQIDLIGIELKNISSYVEPELIAPNVTIRSDIYQDLFQPSETTFK